MSLSNRRARNEPPIKLPTMSNSRDSALPQPSQSEPPASFDDWLDRRLKVLYDAVVKEPLPPEILELLHKTRDAK